MKILVVAATPVELNVVKLWIKSANLKTNLNIDFLCCWIWNYETISSLEHYLTENKEPTFIWNIWICGYWNPNNEKLIDPIQVASVINIHTQKELIIPPFLQIAPLKNCFCGEYIVHEKPEFGNKFWFIEGEMYFDMESWWVEFVASKYKCPRLILKIPFNFVGEDSDSLSIFEMLKNLPYHDYLCKILEWLDKQ
jgi:hypothetical protein